MTEDELEAFRAEICDAALELFVRRGFEGVSMRAVARQVGTSASTLYGYFEGKDELWAAVRARSLDDFAEHHRARIEEITDPRERLLVLARSYIAYARERAGLFGLIFDMNQPDIGEYPALDASAGRAWWVLYQAVRQAAAAGVMAGDPVELAYMVWSSVHGLAALERAGVTGRRVSAEALVERTVRALIQANRPEPDRDDDSDDAQEA